MSTTQRAALAAVSVALVALGLFLILDDDAAPAPGVAPLEAAPPPALEPSPAVAAPSVAPVVPPVAEAVIVEAGVDAGAASTGSPPHVELAPSPFETSDSAELQYAVKLVLSDTSGPYEWRNAVEVFRRCLDQSPLNHLCKRGLYAAWERLDSDGGRPTALSAEGPLAVDPAGVRRATTDRPDGIEAPSLKARMPVAE
ncbi:MAG: hypothetical protein IAE78_14070 [Myxococcus sp.]|nr:hypothetical protein [Myxococcus sp.]